MDAGTYQTPEGLAEVPPARIKHWHDTVQALIAAGHKPPVSWGHVSKAVPHTDDDAQYWASAWNAGKVVGSRILPGDTLEFEIDCPGVELDEGGRAVTVRELPDGSRVKTAVEEVSIGSRDWTDGSGREWKDAPIHLALTPLPVWVPQGGQPPFEVSPKGQSFGMGNLLYRFATDTKGPPMADETKDTNGDGKAGEAPAGGGGVPLKKVLALLAKAGITLPDDTTPENLIERLYVAATAKEGAEGGGDLDDAAAAPAESAEPVMMSTIRDPITQALARRVAEADRKARLERVEALKARGLPGHEAKRLREEASAQHFSVNPKDGSIAPHPVDAQLDLLERVLPKGGFAQTYLSTTVAGASEAAPPEEKEGAAKHRSVADELARAAGLPPRQKKTA